MESYEESDFIFDDYDHANPEVFYTVTRIPGNIMDESKFEYFQNGCNCPNSQCTEQTNCSCLRYGINYKSTEEGLVLMEEKFGNVPVFECNLRCSCIKNLKLINRNEKLGRGENSRLCPNRNIQFGPARNLEIFDAGPKGLGLKTKAKIPSGGFICEYAGEVIDLEEAKQRQKRLKGGMNYIFILKEFSGDKLSSVTCVDPTHVGNLGRYINHSCQPNSAIVPVRVNDSVPWLCVFARREIEEGEEICYDYSGHGLEEVPGEGGDSRKPCFCGADACRQFLPFASRL